WEKLYVVAYRKLRNKNVAEEVVQEVFLQLWRKREEIKIDNLSAYLAAMTRYAIYRYVASENKMKQREEIYLGNRPDTLVQINYDHRFLLEMINQLSCELPEKCRLVFTYNKL